MSLYINYENVIQIKLRSLRTDYQLIQGFTGDSWKFATGLKMEHRNLTKLLNTSLSSNQLRSTHDFCTGWCTFYKLKINEKLKGLQQLSISKNMFLVC